MPELHCQYLAWQADQPLWMNLSGAALYFSPGAGLTTEDIAAHLSAMINVTFPGVWCTSDGGSIHIRSRAPSFYFAQRGTYHFAATAAWLYTRRRARF